MKELPLCLPALAIGVVLMAGCAGLDRAPQQRSVAASAEAMASDVPRADAAATPSQANVALPLCLIPAGDGRLLPALGRSVPSPSLTVAGGAVAAAPFTRAAELARPQSTVASSVKPAVSTPLAPPKLATAVPPNTPALKTQQPATPVAKPAVPPPLDLKSLETRLKETKAIGVFTKLALKNQIDDLLERFRAFFQGRIKTSLVELRRSFDLLVMKTLALLQDADPSLAGALASSRESIWGILSDPAKLATV